MFKGITKILKGKFAQKITIREALNKALDEELAHNSKVFIMGEEVANYHGAYKITKGLIDKWGPERLWDTPITEAGFTGIGCGAALMGLTPVIEFMTMNFSLQAIDHIVNSAAKLHYMSAGELKGGIVFRGLNGPAAAVAAQHSQCFASWYSNIPGLITISPYDAEDNKGLLKAAIRSGEVVMFLENENLYGEHF
jgi:pyruvate dehydrogenase E1 component beta subunit